MWPLCLCFVIGHWLQKFTLSVYLHIHMYAAYLLGCIRDDRLIIISGYEIQNTEHFQKKTG